MNPQPFEIYNAKVTWRGCEDIRPWLIVECLATHYRAFPISGQCYDGPCFPIEQEHLASCGLSKPCFIHDARLYELKPNQLLKYRGRLEGSLLEAFRDYAGI